MQTRGLINGEWLDADDGGTFAVTDPASGEIVAHVPAMGADETERAIAAAESWLRSDGGAAAAADAERRATWLQRIADGLLSNKQALARTLTREQGKPLPE